jgi:hypothetical protein
MISPTPRAARVVRSSTITQRELRRRSFSSFSITPGRQPMVSSFTRLRPRISSTSRLRTPENTIVRLAPGDYSFVSAPTVIDLTRPEVEYLSAIVSAPAYKFVVQLRLEHVKAIDAAVLASTVIVRKVKKLILAGYG